MSFTRLPCGGSITTGDSLQGDVLRVRRVLREGSRNILFILARPPAKGAPDKDLDLCVKSAARRGFDVCTTVYLFPFRVQNVRELEAILVPQGAGPTNRQILRHEIHLTHWGHGTVVAAWGDDGLYKDAGNRLLGRFNGSLHGGVPSEFVPFMILGRTRRRAPAVPTAKNIYRPLQSLGDAPGHRSAA